MEWGTESAGTHGGRRRREKLGSGLGFHYGRMEIEELIASFFPRVGFAAKEKGFR